MNKRQKENMAGFDKIKTILGVETELNGDLRFKESLMIRGKFSGTIKTEGYLEIASGAKVVAEIEAKYIKISGYLKGNINNSDRVELVNSAEMIGNIKTKILKIDDGVLFQGKCEMKR